MKKGFYCDKDGEILLITENESNNFEVKSNNELFKQALVEGLNRHFDKTIEEAKKMEQIEIFITEVEALPDCITEFRTDYWGAPGREGHGASEGSDDLYPFLRGGD